MEKEKRFNQHSPVDETKLLLAHSGNSRTTGMHTSLVVYYKKQKLIIPLLLLIHSNTNNIGASYDHMNHLCHSSSIITLFNNTRKTNA